MMAWNRHRPLLLLVPILLEEALCSGGCCASVEVIQRDKNDSDARLSQPKVFTNFTLEPELLNGRVHYTSHDGAQAIAYHEEHGQWFIQPADRK